MKPAEVNSDFDGACPTADVEPGSWGGERDIPPFNEGADRVALRRWPRYCVGMTVQVRVTTQGPTRVAMWEGHGTDISVGGLAVTVDSDLPISSQVAVQFTVPGADQAMTFRCFVRNREGNRYGVEFITENDDDYRNAGELQALLATMTRS